MAEAPLCLASFGARPESLWVAFPLSQPPQPRPSCALYLCAHNRSRLLSHCLMPHGTLTSWRARVRCQSYRDVNIALIYVPGQPAPSSGPQTSSPPGGEGTHRRGLLVHFRGNLLSSGLLSLVGFLKNAPLNRLCGPWMLLEGAGRTWSGSERLSVPVAHALMNSAP